MPPTTTAVVELRIKDQTGVEQPGVYSVRLTARDKYFLLDQSIAGARGVFERAYEVVERCLVGVKDVPGVEWRRNFDVVAEQLGVQRVVALSAAIMEAGKLTEDERKN